MLRYVLLSAVLILGWLPNPSPLVAQEKPVRLPITQKHIDDSLTVDWYGLYLKDKKLGWARSSMERVKVGETPVYRIKMELTLKAKSAGIVLEQSFNETIEFEGKAPYKLRRVHVLQAQDGAKQETVVKRGKKGFVVETNINGRTSTRPIGELDYNLADDLSPYVWLLNRPKRGATLRVRTFDSEKFKMDVSRYEVKAVKASIVKGVKLNFYEVEVVNMALKTPMLERFDDKGNLLSGVIGGVLEIRLESEKDAKNLAKSFDLFLSGLIKIDRPIGDVTNVSGLVVELKGGDARLIPSGPRQTVTRDKDGKFIGKLGKPFGKKVKAKKKEVADALEATSIYPAKNQQIQALARKAVGDAKTPREKVKRLVKFVNKFIRPSLRGKGTLVLDLLEKKRGDCTAYAAMFTTLARAAGIPCREVSGVAYMGDGSKSFGGHAWNEVVLDDVWHPIDASMGQFEIDPAHLSLGSAEEGSLNMLRNFGAMSLRLIEVQRKPVANES